MTQVMSHARKFTRAEMRNVRKCGEVFTHTVDYMGLAIACERNTLQLGIKVKSSQLIPVRCLPPLIC